MRSLINFLFILSFLTGCTDTLENPNVDRIVKTQTRDCEFEQDNIKWELAHGVTADRLIEAVETCKHAKYKRGDILKVKQNNNCKFQIYRAKTVYPDRVKGKISALYIGKEDCNGIVDDWASRLETELKR